MNWIIRVNLELFTWSPTPVSVTTGGQPDYGYTTQQGRKPEGR